MKKFNTTIIFVMIIFLISGCYNKIKELNPDSLTYCENIKNKDLQERCFIEYAKKIAAINDEEALIACGNINTSLLKDICFFETVKVDATPNKIAFCEEIEDSSLQFKCLRFTYRPHLAKLTD